MGERESGDAGMDTGDSQGGGGPRAETEDAGTDMRDAQVVRGPFAGSGVMTV